MRGILSTIVAYEGRANGKMMGLGILHALPSHVEYCSCWTLIACSSPRVVGASSLHYTRERFGLHLDRSNSTQCHEPQYIEAVPEDECHCELAAVADMLGLIM